MSTVDLGALRGTPPAQPRGRRPLGLRLFGGFFMLLTAAVALSFAWPLLVQPRPVATAAVRLAADDTTAARGSGPEAVGWVEPDPFPTIVRPLVSGRLESVLVLEGSAVTAGETILATLDSAVLRAAVERADAAVIESTAALATAKTNLAHAQARVAQNAELRRNELQAFTAQADVAERLARALGNRDRATAALRGAESALAAQQSLAAAGGSNRIALARAEAEVAAAAAEATAAAAMAEALQAEQQARGREAELASELRQQPVDLLFAVQLAEQEVERATAALATAIAEQTIANREFTWLAVTAPCSGIVLRLLAPPGTVVGPDGDGILALYDPAALRARIDVPLGSVSGIAADQSVELSSEVTGKLAIRGIVQRLQHESDLLKNTLQVKVGLIDPPALWRPETLVRARFHTNTANTASTAEPSFLVPATALREDRVFCFDSERQRARAVPVTVLERNEASVRVRGELSPTHRVILDPVVDGERVREARR